MRLMTPADSWLYWLAVIMFAFAIGTAVLRRWVAARAGVRRGVLFVSVFIGAALVVGLLPSAMLGVLTGAGWDAATPEIAVWWSGAMVTGLVGLAVLGRLIVGDPSRGRRRCGKCWYDMSGTPGLQCPECGRTAKAEKRLFRTRRPKRWLVLAGVLLIVSGTGAVVPIWDDLGWEDWVPDTVLIALLPHLDSQSSLVHEVNARVLDDWKEAGEKELPAGWWRRFAAKRCLAAMRDTSEGGRIDTALFLGESLGDDRGILRDRLFELAEDADPRVRVRAMIAMGWFIQDGDTVALLEEALTDPAPDVRTAAVKTLGFAMRRGDLPMAPPSGAVLDMIANEAHPQTLNAALQMLCNYRASSEAVETLVTALKHPLGSIRRTALRSLCRLDPQSAECVGARMAALADPEAPVVRDAALEIGRHGPHENASVDRMLGLADGTNEGWWAVFAWIDGVVEKPDSADEMVLGRALEVGDPWVRLHVLDALAEMRAPPRSLLPKLLAVRDALRDDAERPERLEHALEAMIARLSRSAPGAAE